MVALNVSQVQVKTAAIEIKTLILEKKQVTLSVFRQVSNEELLNCNNLQYSLNGIPWGTINYFFGDNKDKDDSQYMHIVWQKGNELRRCVVAKSFDKTNDSAQIRSELRYQRECYFSYVDEEKKDRRGYNSNEFYENNIIYLEGQLLQLKQVIEKRQKTIDENNHIEGWKEKNSYQFLWLKEEIEKSELLTVKIEEKKQEALQYKASVEDLEKDLEALTKSYNSLIASLIELPQLFIAI
jgi:hypothetical protein